MYLEWIIVKYEELCLNLKVFFKDMYGSLNFEWFLKVEE